MLEPYRVLDCTDDAGHLAGMMLAQMGAEVILIEPSNGSRARRRHPFAQTGAAAGTSLWHSAYNRGKRSVVLDLAAAAGGVEGRDMERFERLAATADVVLWSGRSAELPFDPEALAASNDRLIVGLLTAFGRRGPKADWQASDLTVCAAGCQLALTGNSNRAPLRTGVPQSFHHGAGDLAVGVLMALNERARSGRGQIVDVSAQEAFLQASFAYALNEAWQNAPLGRSGEGINVGPFVIRWGYPALDGEVSITLLFGAAFKEFTPNLFRWIWEEGGCDEATRDKPWEDLIVRMLDGREPISEIDRIADVVAAFTSTRTKAQLVAGARKHRVLLAPVSTLSEVMASDHLAARGVWDEVGVRAGAPASRHLGRFIVASATPLRSLGPAPELGADTDAIIAALATAADAEHKAAGERVSQQTVTEPMALDGLKVLDLTWSIAGPYVGRGLADFGATVVKVETRHRVDVTRTVMPLHPLDAEHPLECGGLFANSNAGKLGIEIDLGTDAGRSVLWDLLRWADVVLESFSAGAFERMGFGYERVAAENPSVVMLSSCLPGQTGSLDLPGYGNLSSAMFGFHYTTRWPDLPAAGPFGAYTDTVSPRFALAALLGALDHRRRTGRGQYLDLSQVESSLHLLSPALLDAEVNGRDHVSLGNGDPDLAPHGVYPTLGEDQWIAVVCTSDAAWAALSTALGRTELAGLSTAQRIERRDELDEVLAAWTGGQLGSDLETYLQQLGVASHVVQNSAGCLADPQLTYRNHYVTVEHPFIGPVLVEGPRYQLSRTPGHIRGPGPTYGQHTFEVLTDLLGYDVEHIAEIAAEGALG